jgi:hypothetical protein
VSILLLYGAIRVSSKEIAGDQDPVVDEPNKGLPRASLIICWALAMTAVGFYAFVLTQ